MIRQGGIYYFLIFFSLQLFAQPPADTLTLQACYDSLYSQYPLAKQKYFQDRIRELKIKNVQAGYLPSINLGAQSSVQSDVPHLEINTESPAMQSFIENLKIPTPPLFQNRIYVDISEPVYDGGLISAQKKLENTYAEIQQKSIEVELYTVREKINSLFYGILYLKTNEETFHLLMSDLQSRRKQVQAGVSSGMLLESNLHLIEAEILKLEQQLIDLHTQRKNLTESLSEIIRRPVTEQTVLVLPEYQLSMDEGCTRPEIELLQLQKVSLEQSALLHKAVRRPKIVLFGQGGYGRPGLNMLSDKFEPYGIIGLRLACTLFDWGQTNRNLRLLDYQKNIIDTKIETYLLNQRIALRNELNVIEKMEKILQHDDRIVELRSKVSRISASKYENGVLSLREYLTEKYNEAQAIVNRNLHKIQLQNARLNYLTICGKIK